MIPPSSLGSYGAVVGPRRERRKGPEYCFVSGKAPRNRGFVVGRRMSHNIYFTTLNEKCWDGITIVRDSGMPLEREYCSQTAVAIVVIVWKRLVEKSEKIMEKSPKKLLTLIIMCAIIEI